MRWFTIPLFLAATANAGRNPAPRPLAGYVGTAHRIVVGRVVRVLRIGVETQPERTLLGKESNARFHWRPRSVVPRNSGARRLDLKSGVRILVILERDGRPRDWGSVQRLGPGDCIRANGVSGLGVDVKSATQAVARLMDEKQRAVWRKELDDPKTTDRSLRTLAMLRDRKAAPKIIALARTSKQFRGLAIAHLGFVPHPDAVPVLCEAIDDGAVTALAQHALRTLRGKRRAHAIRLLSAPQRSSRARAMAVELSK